MQHEIEDRLSEEILHGRLVAGDHVTVDFVGGEFVFETGRQPGREAVAETPEVVGAIEAS